jgi:hypothetical protein
VSPADRDAATPEPPPHEQAAREQARRRRLAEIFGEELPEQTSDDTDDPRESRDGDAWLRGQVPPHHG